MAYADFTVKQLAAAVRKAALANPKYVYSIAVDGYKNSCAYFKEDGTPGCIVGHGLAALGISKDLVEDGVNTIDSDAILKYLGLARGETTYDSLWLSLVQNNQDSGQPWLKAVEIADINTPMLMADSMAEEDEDDYDE
jgi:hypothetical protein